MKIVAIKIGNHWYRASAVLPVIVEYFSLFAVSRMRYKTWDYLEKKYGFNDVYKYAYYDMRTNEFHNLQKPNKNVHSS